MSEDNLPELFAPEIITSKDKTLKLRKSEFTDHQGKLIKFFVLYKEIPPNKTPMATAILLHETKMYGLTIRKGKDRFWRVTSIFSTSDKDDKFRNRLFDPPIVLKDKLVNQQLMEAEEEMPEIRKI